jgi:hypothetical protein
MTHDPRARLIALLTRLAPDVAQKLWRVDDVRRAHPFSLDTPLG